MFTKIEEAVVQIEYCIEAFWREKGDQWDNLLRRWAEVRQSYRDAEDAERSYPELKAHDELQMRQYYAQEYPNVTVFGHWLICRGHDALFLYETAAYVISGRMSRAWSIEMCREADEELLSYAY